MTETDSLTQDEWDDLLAPHSRYMARMLDEWVEHGARREDAAYFLFPQEMCEMMLALFMVPGAQAGFTPAADGMQTMICRRTDLAKLIADDDAAVAIGAERLPLVYVVGPEDGYHMTYLTHTPTGQLTIFGGMKPIGQA